MLKVILKIIWILNQNISFTETSRTLERCGMLDWFRLLVN